ncbi:MAG: hypothetical protein GVY26_08010 [Bacteroidetes bacterium]|nr:hypothetical protein [Bacteroidota bacterium]
MIVYVLSVVALVFLFSLFCPQIFKNLSRKK